MCIPKKEFHHWKFLFLLFFFFFFFFFQCRQLSILQFYDTVNGVRNLRKHNVHWNIHFNPPASFPHCFFSLSFFFWWLICTLLLLSLEAHFAPLSSTNIALSQRLTQRRQINFFRRAKLHARARKKRLCTQFCLVCINETLIELAICNGSNLPVQKLLLLLISFGASTIFTSLSTVELYATSGHGHFSHDRLPR